MRFLSVVWETICRFAESVLHPIYIWIVCIVAVVTVAGRTFDVSPVEFLSGYAGYSGLFATRLVDLYPAIFAVLTSVLALLTIALGIRIRRRRRSERQVLDLVAKSTKRHTQFVWAISDLLSGPGSAISIDATDDKIAEYLRDLCDDLSSAFTYATRAQCCASIKYFEQKSGDVWTYSRDRKSYQRAVADEVLKKYKYSENAAFCEILDDGDRDFFCSNHLLFRSYLRTYWNARQDRDWLREYRATCVMPITDAIAPVRISKDSVIGFICVDNLRGRFRKDQAQSLLRIYSHLILVTMDISATIQ